MYDTKHEFFTIFQYSTRSHFRFLYKTDYKILSLKLVLETVFVDIDKHSGTIPVILVRH